ncbi:MAG TPA: lysophospholipid acyltransferase family protein [Candidatus Udaeobacter sp.]|nr:lysophospholipid acyltransferase family protein [Candidatus Udaeobacter sp.]
MMNSRHYDSACDVDQPLVDRLRRFPREPDMLVYGVRALIALIIRGWLRVYHRFEIIGQENLRTNRSLVIVANHSSHLDTLCVLASLPLRKLHRAFPAAAADYFFQSVPRTFVAAVVTNALPFARRVRVRRSLSICSELLCDPENILIIFPEGTRSETGETQEFKSGIGALVAGRDITVLPCYLQGAFRAWPKGRHLPRPRKVRLIVGAPRSYSSCKANKADICTIAAELHRAVKKLGESNGSD